MNPTSHEPGAAVATAGAAEPPYRHLRKVQPWPAHHSEPFSQARTELWIPRPALASCMRAVMSRDTRGVALSEGQRYNHFPASPACSIVWYFSGDCELLAPHSQAHAGSPRTPVGRVTFCGPFTRPTISWNPGPMHAMVLLLLPDALARLTGIDPSAWVDRAVPVEDVLDAQWLAWCRQLDEAADDEQRVALVESFLLPRWQQARPHALPGAWLLTDWSHSLALRAATSGLGRSVRQVERRIKRWTGQALRELHGVARSERAFFEAIAAHKSGSVDWSDVASSCGYADQAHMCRQTRRITGFAPEDLRRRAATEESFWAYRLWGFSEGRVDD